MPTPTHVLELNGRKYDAMTGRLLSSAPSVDGMLPATQAAHAHHKPRLSAAPVRTATGHSPLHPIKQAAPKMMLDVQRAPAHHAKPHQLQHSQTLMRAAVHHPGKSFKRQTPVASHTGALVPKVHFDVIPKQSAALVDEGRLHRAAKISRSQLIQRFEGQAPEHRIAATYQPRQTPAPAHRAAPVQPAPQREEPDDVFERALAAASQPAPRSAKKHVSKGHRLRQITSVAASVLAVLLIVGFTAYQNATYIQLRLVSSRAGINATLPAWQPSGFHLGTFAYGPGSVTVKYQNPANGQQFTIAQTSSSWDSATLLSDFVYPNNSSYDTINTNGTTIYTYDKIATWVSGGIWYKLSTGGTLDTSQIVNIATSM